MKTLTLRYEEKEYNKLKTAKMKTNLTWEKFVLIFCTAQKIKPLIVKNEMGLKTGKI